MASVATTWCPSSFQLRLAFTCRRPTPHFVRIPRIHRRVFCVDGNGNATEPVRVENDAWVNSSSKSSGDEFSGWSGVNGSQSDESKGNKWSGGKICVSCQFFVTACDLTNYVIIRGIYLGLNKHNHPGIQSI